MKLHRQIQFAIPHALRVVLGCGILTTLAVATPANAANFQVDTLSDTAVANDNQLSLREAIVAALANAEADTVNFAPGLTGTITLQNALPNIVSDLTINGPGAKLLTLDGGGVARLFFVGNGGRSGPNFSINGLTLSGGRAQNAPGAQGDEPDSRGGAIYSGGGTTNVDNVVISGNSAQTQGGGIYSNFGNVTVTNSTIANNTAGSSGGGLYNINGTTISISNSTIFGNTAGTEGGGISNLEGTINIDSSTLARNSAPTGATIFNDSFGFTSSTTTLANSILAKGGAAGANVAGRGTIASGGNNISDDGTGASDASDLRDTDPLLASGLADNGGPTLTLALQEGSPAIDGGQTDLATDQRGIARPQRGADDVGAFEAQLQPLNIGVSLSPKGPRTLDTLTATPLISDADRPDTTFSYEFSVNGRVVQTGASNTLNLAESGNGDKGDVVSVTVTANKENGRTGSNSNQVTVQNSAPFAFSKSVVAQAGQETAIPLSGADLDDEVLTFKRVGGPQNGTAEIRADANGQPTLFYTSRPKFGGVEVIRFVAIDQSGRPSAPSTVAIDVRNPLVPPTAQDFSATAISGQTISVPITPTRDSSGDPLTFKRVGGPRNGVGEFVTDARGTRFVYRSRSNFTGVETIRYVSLNNVGRPSNVATISVDVQAAAPVSSSAIRADKSGSGGAS